MRLSQTERSRLLAGDYSALKRSERPELEEGERAVLSWSRARTVIVDRDTGETAHYPRRPVVWVEFGEPRRHRDGSWRVPVQVHDERTKTRFLAPSGAPTGELLDEESDPARGYRSSAAAPVADQLEAVDDAELERQRTQARERWSAHEEEVAAEERVRSQERAVRERLKRAIRGLSPTAAQSLLAGIERAIREAIERDR